MLKQKLSFEESPKRKKKKVDFSKLDFCWTFRVVKDDPKLTVARNCNFRQIETRDTEIYYTHMN